MANKTKPDIFPALLPHMGQFLHPNMITWQAIKSMRTRHLTSSLEKPDGASILWTFTFYDSASQILWILWCRDGGSGTFCSPVCIGPRAKKKAVHARYPADAIIGPCQPCLRTLTSLPIPPQLGRSPIPRPAGLVSDSNSSPSDVCMPQNVHLPYYLVWASTKYRAWYLGSHVMSCLGGKRIGSRIF